MTMLSALALVAIAAGIEVNIAPDQPLAYVYVDDPLILELRSETDTLATVHLSITADALDTPVVGQFDNVVLRAKGSSWLALKDLPPVRGYYTVECSIEAAGETTQTTEHFSRIDRPAGSQPLPLFALGNGAGDRVLLALQSAGVRTVRINGMLPESSEQIGHAIGRGFKVVVFLEDATPEEAVAKASDLAKQFCSGIVRWDVASGETGALPIAVAQALRKAECTVPVAAVLDSVAAFQRLLAAGGGQHLREIVITSPEAAVSVLPVLRDTAEKAGYEDWHIHVANTKYSEFDPGLALVKSFFVGLAAGVSQRGFPVQMLFDEQLQPSAVYLNSLAHRLFGSEYAGPLLQEERATAPLFRHEDNWLAVLWSDHGSKDIDVLVEDARNITLVDARNNPMALPERQEGVLRLTIGPAPVYLSGSGGNVISRAAEYHCQRLLATILQETSYQTVFSPELLEALNGTRRAVTDDASAEARRSHFHTILRALPELEQRWHSGGVGQEIAAPAIADLARLARAMATVEEQGGKPFLDPLSDTFARSEEFQSLHLTGSSGSNRSERSDWLLHEVQRLMDEAEMLSGADRKIEASAVATLAEWRARALDIAAKAAPLKTPDDWQVAVELPTTGTETAPEPVEAPAPVPEVVLPEQLVHSVARGENLSSIADKYEVTLEELLAWNKLKKGATLSIGQEILVSDPAASVAPPVAEVVAPPAEEAAVPQPVPPPAEEAAVPLPVPPVAEEAAPTALAETEATAPEVDSPAAGIPPDETEAREITHTVVRGENPSIIADKYNVALEDFLAWNKLSKRSMLSIGQKLIVRTAQTPETAPATDAAPAATEPVAPEPVVHTVRSGEFPATIAKRYGVSVEELLRWNNLKRGAVLHVGDQLTVHSKGSTPENAGGGVDSPSGKKITHTIKRGDTPYLIGKRYGVDWREFLKWNNLSQNAVLHVGQEYVVYLPE